MGNNNNGQLGNGSTTSLTEATLLDIEDVKDIESNGTTMFLKEN